MQPLDDTYRNHIGRKLTNRLGKALEQGEIENENFISLCDMILATFETMKYREEIHSLLKKLSVGWPFFVEILEEEQGKQQAVTKIESLFSNRNVHLIGSSR